MARRVRLARSTRVSPPGTESAHKVLSESITSLRTVPPARPSRSLQTLHLCCCGDHMAKPSFVASHSRRSRSLTVAQTTESGKPSGVDQPSHSLRPGHRSTPPPPKRLHGEPTFRNAPDLVLPRDQNGIVWRAENASDRL